MGLALKKSEMLLKVIFRKKKKMEEREHNEKVWHACFFLQSHSI